MSTREQQRISKRLRSPTYPKRCVHHALFSDRCILCLKARIRELTKQLESPRKAAEIVIGVLEKVDLPETAQTLREIFLDRKVDR